MINRFVLTQVHKLGFKIVIYVHMHWLLTHFLVQWRSKIINFLYCKKLWFKVENFQALAEL